MCPPRRMCPPTRSQRSPSTPRTERPPASQDRTIESRTGRARAAARAGRRCFLGASAAASWAMWASASRRWASGTRTTTVEPERRLVLLGQLTCLDHVVLNRRKRLPLVHPSIDLATELDERRHRCPTSRVRSANAARIPRSTSSEPSVHTSRLYCESTRQSTAARSGVFASRGRFPRVCRPWGPCSGSGVRADRASADAWSSP